MTFSEMMAERLRTQDNRCTAEPIFLVQQRRRIYGLDPDYSDKFVWMQDGYEADEEEAKKYEEAYQNGDYTPEDATRTYYEDTWEFVSCFLTHQGAEDFIKARSHELTDPRIYVDSAHRNGEWKALRAYFLEMSK